MIPRWSVRGLALGLAVAHAVACRGAVAPRGTGDGLRVLFIGNSLTYTNDIPGIVQALADSAGGEQIVVDDISGPDMALVDHWDEGEAQRAVARGWDIVVLQQGPSSVEVNRDSLRMFTDRFAKEIVKAGGRPALYSVWPAESRQQDFPRAIESYTLAAADVDGLLLPVARAWLETWDRDPSVRLYDADGLHPSEAGSYLAALVIYARLLDRSPVGLPSRLTLRRGGIVLVEPTLAELLQGAAAEAIQVTPASLRSAGAASR